MYRQRGEVSPRRNRLNNPFCVKCLRIGVRNSHNTACKKIIFTPIRYSFQGILDFVAYKVC